MRRANPSTRSSFRSTGIIRGSRLACTSQKTSLRRLVESLYQKFYISQVLGFNENPLLRESTSCLDNAIVSLTERFWLHA